MNLTPQALEFSNLILKHFGKKPDSHEDHHHHHDHKSEHVEQETAEAPKTNKDKYSLDYSKWDNLEREDKARKPKSTEEEEYKKMMGCFHDRRKERQLFEKSTKEKLEAAERFKKEGNKLFQNKEYQRADVEYQKALIQFDYTFPDTPEEEKEMEKLQEQCHTNMALVKFHLKDYKESILQCDLAIKINSKSMKAKYRKACALLELGEYEKTLEEIKEALNIDPNAQDFIGLKDKTNQKIVEYKKKQEKLSRKMFGSE